MKINMANWDRFLRLIIGTLLLAWAVAGGPWWAYFGFILIATSAWRFDPFYMILKTGTYREPTVKNRERRLAPFQNSPKGRPKS